MIFVRFSFRAGCMDGFEIRGHSGSAAAGRDIVCAAVSSPAYMAVNTLTGILGLHPEVREGDGLLSVSLCGEEARRGEELLRGLRLHLLGLSKQYPNYIKIERGTEHA